MWNLYFDTFTLKTNRKKEGDLGGKPVCIAMSCLQRRAVSRPNKRPWSRLPSPISPHMGHINPEAYCRFIGAISPHVIGALCPPQCNSTCYITRYIKMTQRGSVPGLGAVEGLPPLGKLQHFLALVIKVLPDGFPPAPRLQVHHTSQNFLQVSR